MLHLPNGCTCSNITIHPSNWDKAGASIKNDWYIQFYFYDPGNEDPKKQKRFCILKGGVNKFKTLQERRMSIKMLNNKVCEELNNGYNPILKQYVHADAVKLEFCESTPFYEALDFALSKLKVTQTTIKNIESALKRIKKAIINLKYDNLQIGLVKRKNIRFILDECGNQYKENGVDKLPWTATTFNHYRTYLMMLFAELLELELIENDPVSKIKKGRIEKKYRDTLSMKERQKINDHFLSVDPYYHRFLDIFFHSGSRELELLRLRPADVDLSLGTFKVKVNKGAESHTDIRPIKNIIRNYWVELIREAKGNDFLFGPLLRPGATPCTRDYVTKKWEREVKKKLNIKVDLYSLKHLNLDETAAILDLKDASKMAGHSSTVVTMEHYTFGEKARQNERLRKVSNSFAG